jgi:hypothetical protein
MHRFRQATLRFLGCFALVLAGCAGPDAPPVPVRSVYVEEAFFFGAPSPALALCGDVIHDTSVRVLQSRGYVAATERAGADAILYAVWYSHPVRPGMPVGKVSLRLTLADRSGTVLDSFDVISDQQASFLSKERIADLVRDQLRKLGR